MVHPSRAPRPLSIALVLMAALPVAARAQQQQPRNQQGWPCTGKVDPGFVRTAEATGGKLFLFQPSEMTGAAEDLTASSRHPQLVFRASDRLADEARDYLIPIDSTIESVYVFVSLQCLDSATLVRPNGDEVRVDAPDVEHHAFQAVRLFVVKAPDPGAWTVRVAGRGVFSVVVSAKSDLALSYAVVEGDKPIPGLPVAGKSQRLEANVSRTVTDVSFEFLSPAGKRLQALALTRSDALPRQYAGEVTPPNAEFRLAVSGTDSRGFRFQRMTNAYFLVPR